MTAGPATPLIWALTSHRAGDNAQVRRVADALGGEMREVALTYNRLHEAPNLLSGGSLHSVSKGAEQLAPPWPDFVVAAGRRAAPVALWVRRRSAGRTKLIHIGRPRARLSAFDLALTTPQYGLPARDNVCVLSLPLAPPQPATRGGGGVMLIIGGDSWAARLSDHVIDRAAALAQEAAKGRKIRAATAPRTSAAQAARLRAVLGADAELYDWRAAVGADNPYRDWLAEADEIVVTGDSVSALSDALMSGAPTTVAPPETPVWLRVAAALGGSGWLRSAGNAALLAPPPFLPAIWERLAQTGCAVKRPDGAWRIDGARDLIMAEHEAALSRARALLG